MSRSTLNPELLWVGRDCCYRLNPTSEEDSPGNGGVPGRDRGAAQLPRPQQRQQLRPVGQLEEEDELEEARAGGCPAAAPSSATAASAASSRAAEIEDQLVGCRIDSFGGGFRLLLPVPSAFHGYLIGRHGDAKRRLEAETGVELRIPRMGDTGSPVQVLAKTRAQLASAKTRLDLLLDYARDRLPITHFLSLCVASEEVVGGFAKFRDLALRWCGGDRGVVEAVFQRPARLHVTCAPLLLLTAQDVARAKQMLDEFAAEELPRLVDSRSSGPLTVSLRGLEIMTDDPTDTRVLYALPGDPTGRLQALVNALAVKFAPLARAQPGREGVKLHVTVMNAKFASDDAAPGSNGGGNRSQTSFDASHLLSKFSGFDFGSASIDSVQLSKSSSGVARDAYYVCEHKVPLV